MRGSRTARLNHKLILQYRRKYPELSMQMLAQKMTKENPELGVPDNFRKVISTWLKMTDGGTNPFPVDKVSPSVRWVITTNPKHIDESIEDYRNKLVQLCTDQNISSDRRHILNVLRKYKAEWTQTHESLNKDGEVISQKFKVAQEDISHDESQLQLVGKTTNPNGKDWYRFKVGSIKPPTIDKELIKEAISGINIISASEINVEPSEGLLRLIYTDAHIAMETNENGTALFGGVWNAKELQIRKDEMIRRTVQRYQGEREIHLIDLGDLMDGWDGQTTRKGHDLPQNMDNREAFNVALKFKVELADQIQKRTGAIVKAYNVVNDNHGGIFSGVVNDAVQQVIDLTNENVDHIILDRFMEHYTWNNHCFIMCHGKDSKQMKFGLKPKLDDKGKDKIEGYIKFHKLFDYAVTFEKGDSHQQLFDYDSSEMFDYFNYRALSPASEWVQTNFKAGVSGFSIMRCEKGQSGKEMMNYEFDWREK